MREQKMTDLEREKAFYKKLLIERKKKLISKKQYNPTPNQKMSQ